MNSKTSRALLSIGAALMVAAPAAQAMPIDPESRSPAHVAQATLGMEYGDLRAQPATGDMGTVESPPAAQPVTDSGGFSWPSAAAGAAALALLAWMALGIRRSLSGRVARA